jgi:hypothetical protein
MKACYKILEQGRSGTTDVGIAHLAMHLRMSNERLKQLLLFIILLDGGKNSISCLFQAHASKHKPVYRVYPLAVNLTVPIPYNI